MEAWKPTDVVAIASLVGGIFGKGGGNELNSALTMEAMVERMGKKAGRKAWEGFRSKNDPEAPTTISKPFPYETESAFAKRGLALPEAEERLRTADRLPAPRPRGGTDPGLNTVGGRLTRGLEEAGHASNWELVSKKNSADGHPIAVMGPQVGYYVPQILMEEDLHGPGIDARGASFPGINLYVELGHGRDYAWSATTATSDNVDTFAEVLCKDKFHYLYKGKCLAMEKLSKKESWTPNTIDQTAAGSQTLTAYRTVHGIVYARGKADGKKVAFVHDRSTYFHEADSVIGFGQLNEPASGDRGQGLQKSGLQHQLPLQLGLRRRRTTSPTRCRGRCRSGRRGPRRTSRSSAPASTTGRASTRRRTTAEWLPFAKHPQAVDPRLPGVLEQQAGAGMGGGRRQVRLRAGAAPADDRRPHPRRHQGQQEDDDRPAGPGDGGTGDRGPARRQDPAAAAEGDRHAEVGEAEERRWRS